MIAHVAAHGAIDAVCVGDVNTGELYFFGPDQVPTRRRYGVASELKKKGLGIYNRYALLRDHPEKLPLILQDLILTEKGGLFKDVDIESGSIGIQMARLWKDEVALLILLPSFETPWDTTPCIGMNKALDIVHVSLYLETLEFKIIDPELPKEVTRRDYIELMLRRQHLEGIMTWIKDWKEKHV
jgi:hypothetical protein